MLVSHHEKLVSECRHILSQKEVQALFPYDVKMTRRSRVFDYMIRQIPQMHYLRYEGDSQVVELRAYAEV